MSKKFQNSRYVAVRDHGKYSIKLNSIDGRSKSKMYSVKKTAVHDSDEYLVSIKTVPACTCPAFVSTKGQLCKHILMVLLKLGVGVDDPILFQTSYTESELFKLYSRTLGSFQASGVDITPDNYKKARHQFYLVTYRKNKPGPRPRCGGCKAAIQDGLCHEIYARYKCKTFTTAKACYYHLSNDCMEVPAKHTDLPSEMPKTVRYFGVSAAVLAMAKKSIIADSV